MNTVNVLKQRLKGMCFEQGQMVESSFAHKLGNLFVERKSFMQKYMNYNLTVSHRISLFSILISLHISKKTILFLRI